MKVAWSIMTLIVLVGCNGKKYNGTLQVNENFSIESEKRRGTRLVNIDEGQYQAKIKVSSRGKLTIESKGIAKKKISIKIDKDKAKELKKKVFNLSAADINQNFGLQGV